LSLKYSRWLITCASQLFSLPFIWQLRRNPHKLHTPSNPSIH